MPNKSRRNSVRYQTCNRIRQLDMYSVLGLLVVCVYAIPGVQGQAPAPDYCARVLCPAVFCEYGVDRRRSYGQCCPVCRERPGRPGKCPDLSPLGICETGTACKYDDDCNAAQRCCQNNCGGTICKQSDFSDLECNYRGTRYGAGTVFRAGDDCNSCTCEKDGRVVCTDYSCNDNNGNCPDLPRYWCWWWPRDQCKDHKDCKPGPEICCPGVCGSLVCMRPKTPPNKELCLTKRPCILPDCPNPVQRSGECCPVCPGCSVYSNVEEGERVACDTGNQCTECVCERGVTEVVSTACQVPDCPQRDWIKGFCCYKCPDEE